MLGYVYTTDLNSNCYPPNNYLFANLMGHMQQRINLTKLYQHVTTMTKYKVKNSYHNNNSHQKNQQRQSQGNRKHSHGKDYHGKTHPRQSG